MTPKQADELRRLIIRYRVSMVNATANVYTSASDHAPLVRECAFACRDLSAWIDQHTEQPSPSTDAGYRTVWGIV